MIIQRFLFKNVFNSVGIIFILVGIISVLISAVWYAADADAMKEAVITEGQIDTISDERVYVKYWVDGEEYRQRLSFYSSSMRPGDPIEIYYNIDDPMKIDTKESGIFVLIFAGIGLVMTGTGAGLVIWQKREAAGELRLKESGQLVYAQVNAVSINRRISNNYRHPYILECIYQAPNGERYQFNSGPIWERPPETILGTSVPVYVDRNNIKKYYVDYTVR